MDKCFVTSTKSLSTKSAIAQKIDFEIKKIFTTEGNLLNQRSIPLNFFKTKSDLKCQMKYTKMFLKFNLPGNTNINVFFTDAFTQQTRHSVFSSKQSASTQSVDSRTQTDTVRS